MLEDFPQDSPSVSPRVSSTYVMKDEEEMGEVEKNNMEINTENDNQEPLQELEEEEKISRRDRYSTAVNLEELKRISKETDFRDDSLEEEDPSVKELLDMELLNDSFSGMQDTEPTGRMHSVTTIEREILSESMQLIADFDRPTSRLVEEEEVVEEPPQPYEVPNTPRDDISMKKVRVSEERELKQIKMVLLLNFCPIYFIFIHFTTM